MFSFFFPEKNDFRNAFEFIGTDIHNHIIPGIDDGSEEIKSSLQFIEGLSGLGFSSMVCTPHIMSDLYPNTPETINIAFKKLKKELDSGYAANKMRFAAEYMVNFEFERIVEKKNLLFFGKEKYVLIEMSYLVESSNIRNMIFTLITNGFQPVLAHPERYGFYHQRFSVYEELIDTGCLFQLNMLSIIGHYGKNVQSIAEKLIDKDFISFLGTDLHNLGHLEQLRKLGSNVKALKKLKSIKKLLNQSIQF